MSFILESHYGYNFDSVDTNWEDVKRMWADSAFSSEATLVSSLSTSGESLFSRKWNTEVVSWEDSSIDWETLDFILGSSPTFDFSRASSELLRPSNMDFSSILTDWEDFSTVWDSMVANVESELLGTFTADYVNPDSNFYENSDTNWEDADYAFDSGAFTKEAPISDTILTTSIIYNELGIINTIEYLFDAWDLYINQDEVIYNEGEVIPAGGIDLVTTFAFNNIVENWDSFSHDWESLDLDVETLSTSNQTIEVMDSLNKFSNTSSDWDSIDRTWDSYTLGVE